MVSSILLMAVLVFSIRGFFLGFPRVIARLLGFICGYIVSLSGRQPLANLLLEKQLVEISPLILQVLASAVLFFGTLFLVTVLVTSLFKLTAKVIPGLSELVDKDSPGSRVFGAGTNGFIGAAIVLLGLWGYNLFTDKAPSSQLDHIANNLGANLLSFASSAISTKPTNTPQTRPSNKVAPVTVNRPIEDTQGSIQERLSSMLGAINQSEEFDAPINKLNGNLNNNTNDNNDIMSSLNSTELNSTELNSTELNKLLDNPDIKQLMSDPALRKMALENMQDNPQQLMDALNNPALRDLLNQHLQTAP